jgi:hypothetical protein
MTESTRKSIITTIVQTIVTVLTILAMLSHAA